MGNKMNQDQSKSDQDVENTSSEGNSTDLSAQNSKTETQEIPIEQQTDAETEAKNQQKTQTQIATDSNSEPKKSAAIKAIGLMLLILLLGLIAFGLWKSYQPKEIELQGRVEADTIHVSTKVPSRIEEIYVHDGQKVSKDQELVRLFSPEVDAKKQQALAALQSALALQSTAERGSQQENIDSLYANWQSLKAQEALAKTTYQRGANLFKEGVISR